MSGWRVGHYEVGLRDGGSSWHIGTKNRRECNHDSCRWAEADRNAIARLRTALAEAVQGLDGQCHCSSGLRCDASPCVENVSREEVLAIVAES